MNKLEKFNEVLRTIQHICLILFLILGCICFLFGIAMSVRKMKPLNPDIETERKEPEVIEIIEVVEEPLTPEQEMYIEYGKLMLIEDKKEWFLAYKEFTEKYPDFEHRPTIYDKYTDDEIYIMQRVIETEVYGCDFEAKTHVASVILNRIEGDNNFPNDATIVCTSPNQFVYSRTQISEDTVLALEYAEEIGDTAQGALYFHSMTPTSSWNGRSFKFTDHVGHSFY